MPKKYRFIEDPGHGWLEVPAAEIAALGITDQISAFSYAGAGNVYLEEDCDLAKFANAKGWSIQTAYKHWDHEYQVRTFVRNLPRFSPSFMAREKRLNEKGETRC